MLETASRARTRTVYEPSAGKLPAGKAYDQLPPPIVASFQTSVPLEKPEPSQ